MFICKQSKRLIICLVLLVGFLCASLAASELTPDDLKTENDRASYSLGVQIMNALNNKGLNMNLLFKGITEALRGNELQLTPKGEKPPVELWKNTLPKPARMAFDPVKEYFWVLKTNKGTITIKLLTGVAPMHATSTIYLTNLGFYDNLTFHRVIKGFMAQGGCPLGTGTGGPGYRYAGEFNPEIKHDRPYLLSMANAGPNTDGSQFFLTFVPTPHLDGKHTVFGEVVKGKDVVKKLEAAAGTPPTEKLIIVKASIEEKAT